MNSKVLYFLLTLSIFAMSCTTNQQPQTAIITGKIKGTGSQKITLKSGPIALIDSWIDRVAVGDSIMKTKEDGTFQIEVSLQEPDFYILSKGSQEVQFFLSPKDSLHIDFTSEEIFSGTNAKENIHIQAMRNQINGHRQFINGIDFYNQLPQKTNAILDSLESVYVKTHNEFKDQNKVHATFDQKVLADWMYRKKLYQIVLPPLYKQSTGETLPVNKTYYDDIAKGHFNDPKMLKSLDYILFVEAYLNAMAAGEKQFDNYFDMSIPKIHPKYQQIQELQAHSEIKDYLFNDHLHKSMDSYGVMYLQDIMPQYKENSKDPVLFQQINDRFQEGMKRREEPSEIKIYKTAGNIELEAHIFYPEGFKEGDQRPAYVFFHGGGWSIGVPEWGYKNCKRYRDKGMVAISFEYRLTDIHESNILDCVRDAKSAILWTRKQAESLGIDPDKIVAAGFSAGGHLAACTAILDEYEEKNNAGLSSKPNAIVVHSATYNTLKSGWFNRNTGGKAESISTFHQVKKGLVPGIFFHGTEDHLAHISEFTEFRDKMNSLGNDFEYKIFQNVGHFFGNPKASEEVREMTDDFLVKLGYILP